MTLNDLIPGRLYKSELTIPMIRDNNNRHGKTYAYDPEDNHDAAAAYFIFLSILDPNLYLNHGLSVCKILVKDVVYNVTISNSLRQFTLVA